MEDSYMSNYIDVIFDTFMELHGDRKSGDGQVIIGGLARLGKYKLVVIGYQGNGSVEAPKVPSPAGCRKFSRLMRLAEIFGKPVVVFIDIPVSPLLPALEQQQIDEAIALSLEEMACLKTPVIGVVMGESSASMAIDMCAADRVLMLAGTDCSISLFDEAVANNTDATPLCLNAQELLDLKVVHRIVEGSLEGDLESASNALEKAILEELRQLSQVCPETLVQQRLDRLQRQFANFGAVRLPFDNLDEST